jgi:hypothetical protein
MNGTTVLTNQFASTEHLRDVTPVFGNLPTAMPGIFFRELLIVSFLGVFFNYDISPMMVKYVESRKPFTHFLTDLCAIIGGVFTVAGMIDGAIYSASTRIGRKTVIGKDG